MREALRPVFAPLWWMEAVGGDVPDFDVALFTSVNGVRFGPDGLGRTAYCVGAATADAARARGWQALVMGPDVDAMTTDLVAAAPEGRLAHLSGAASRGALAETLRAAGLNAARHVCYRQVALPMADDVRDLLRTEVTLVPLFSPDGVAHFASEIGRAPRAHLALISPAAAQNLPPNAFASVGIAVAPNAAAMGAALQKLHRALQSG
ncbi:MAG: uroporphyrinogen-III synthase [Pseudomonadota bacterium]